MPGRPNGALSSSNLVKVRYPIVLSKVLGAMLYVFLFPFPPILACLNVPQYSAPFKSLMFLREGRAGSTPLINKIIW